MSLGFGFGSINEMFAPYGQVWCREHYWHYRMEQSDSKAVGCTFAIIILSILLEIVTHFGVKYKPQKQTPDIETEAEANVELLPVSTPHDSEPAGQQQVKYVPSGTWASKNVPNPRQRATRFALGLILYAGVLAAFIVRIRDARYVPYIPAACREEIGLDSPNWTAITFLAIIPFICATFAFVRTLVDCILVRWGKTLGTWTFDRHAMPWPPCAPIVAMLFVAGVAFYLLFECVRVPAALAMGRLEASIWTAEFARGNGDADAERGAEEGQGLVENVDGGEAGGEDEELPAYEEAVGKNGTGKGEGKEVV
ncbi:hypothetical protein DE146DRAFT_749920 [Phaeosphaeria sp. MPI-PUGE-AT-0046c]|nr:hypothetical protein DE146DRAFT_749920 [Phaeosphaeria sp. MPI-PUGE-AT-0046c]